MYQRIKTGENSRPPTAQTDWHMQPRLNTLQATNPVTSDKLTFLPDTSVELTTRQRNPVSNTS